MSSSKKTSFRPPILNLSGGGGGGGGGGGDVNKENKDPVKPKSGDQKKKTRIKAHLPVVLPKTISKKTEEEEKVVAPAVAVKKSKQTPVIQQQQPVPVVAATPGFGVSGTVTAKWAQCSKARMEAFSFFKDNDSFSDVFVFCEMQQFRCHRVVLATGSAYFEHIFTETSAILSPAIPTVVVITDIRQEILRCLIEYMYKGEVTINLEFIQEFQRAGEKLKVRGIGNVAGTSGRWVDNGYMCPTNFLFVQTTAEESEPDLAPISSIIKNVSLQFGTCLSQADSDDMDFRKRPAMSKNSGSFGKQNISATVGKAPLKNGNVSNKVPKARKRSLKEVTENTAESLQKVKQPRRPPTNRGTQELKHGEALADILDATGDDVGNALGPETQALVESMLEDYEKAVAGKSLPIHCVIEVSDKEGYPSSGTSGVSSSIGSGSGCGPGGGGGRGGDKTVGKGETAGGIGNGNSINSLSNSNAGGKVVEVDDFVIIPAGTPFQEVVTTVLTLLGYPKDIIAQAEGSILLKNWKPLKLEQVCDSPHKTVGDILNDLSNHATLRVLVTRPKGGTAEDLKEKLLRLLLAQSSNILMGSGCPLDEVTLGQLVKGQWPQNLAEDVKRRFDQWYQSHQQKLPGLEPPSFSSHSQHPPPSTSHQGSGGNNGNSGSPNNLSVTPSHQSHLANGSSVVSSGRHHHHHHGLDKSTYDDDSHSNHPVFHGLSTQKTRMRTSFDPEMELPRLQQWFAENPHPSRHQIQQYVRDLNNLDCRKDRKPLDLNNVIYWFKNARAAQKRNELRYNGYSPSQTFPHHIHTQNSLSNHHLISRDDNGMNEDQEDRIYNMNENSESSCRDDSADDQNDQEMKEYRPDADDAEAEMDGDNEQSGEKRDNQTESINKRNKECEEEEENEGEIKVVIKEEHEEDFISVDVELTEGAAAVVVGNMSHRSPSPGEGESENCNNNEPKDLSSGKLEESRDEDEGFMKARQSSSYGSSKTSQHHPLALEVVNPEGRGGRRGGGGGGGGSNSTSPSVSPRSSPGMSPSHPYDFSGAHSMVSRFHPFFEHPFMAYRHFNSFNFGQNFSGSHGPEGHSPSAYESALCIVGRKGVMPSGKPSPGIEPFHDFGNGVPIGASSRDPSGSVVNSARGEHLSRMRDDLFASRSASSAELISSLINSNRGELGLTPLNLGSHHQNPNSMALDERRKRNRTFIDPVTEVPRLEQWFTLNTHPSHNLILKYTEELNRMPYRQKFPKLEPKNVQFWFKNRRAKCKRLKMTL